MARTPTIGLVLLAAALGVQGCAGGRGASGPEPAVTAAPVGAAGSGTNLVSGSGVPVGDGSGAAPRPAAAVVAASPAGDARPASGPVVAPRPPAAPGQAPVPLAWPAPGTPVDAYLAAITPRQRECMALMFERQDLTVERIRDMDAFPAGNVLEESRARCDRALPRVDPARLRSDVRCTLDLPGEPVSRCDEVFARTVDGRRQRLSPADALQAELEAGNDPARRVAIVRIERDDAAAERLGAGASRTGAAAGMPAPVAAAQAPGVQAPAPASAPSPSPSPARHAPTAQAPTPNPSAAHASAAQGATGAAAHPGGPAPVPRYQALVTCGPEGHHLRVQDCFNGPKPTALELRRADGTRHVYGPGEILRAGPTGRDGLSLLLDAPFELRARNASDTMLLGVRILDRGTGRTVSFEQASKGGSVTARR